MSLADDLVEAVAREISEVDGHASSVEPCGDATYPQMARAAVGAALRLLAGYTDPTLPPAHSAYWNRADLARLADEVERGGRGE